MDVLQATRADGAKLPHPLLSNWCVLILLSFSFFLSFCAVEEGVMHPSSLESNRAVSCVGNGSTAAAFFAAWGRTVRCLFALRPLLGLLVAAAAIGGVAVALEHD